jgi:UDP-N-acetylglucosamine/UDP-N-acetylgalactosamine 4-epimerase
MTRYREVQESLRRAPRRWLVTGVAGFIGSHLLEGLLRLDQDVVGLDNLATGYQRNLADVAARVGPAAYGRFRFIEGDILDPRACASAAQGADIVLHQAALGSVPRSMADPRSSHVANVDGFVNMLLAARDAGVKRFVYASSSSVYGDEPSEPKVEDRRGRLLSPYAATKLINEVYAETFRRTHAVDSVGLRYFNVFGPRQDPQGAYAAVIPRWIEQLLSGEPCVVFGDGSASRDFCYVDNIVQANLLAALAPSEALVEPVFNVACGARTTLVELFTILRGLVALAQPSVVSATLQREAARLGDVAHSLASIERAHGRLGYRAVHDVASGLTETVRWYAEQAALARRPSVATAAPQLASEAS